MTDTRAISFWGFLNSHKIEIPIIQRDYAQGRKGKEELRKGFLEDIKSALESNNSTLQLDFVYGAEKDKTLNPLDGQQRLTTLWLLHWYIALRAGELANVSETFYKFSYETRISSREFCQQLCTPGNFEGYNSKENISDFITNQTWFYSAWKQDPTIQSMLRMLSGTDIKDKSNNDIIDGIEELFKDIEKQKFEEIWNVLTGDNCPIVFYYLPLTDFGLSDDLYIKMNARGKQLTSFENFKADLIGYIISKKSNQEWDALLDEKEGIPIKMDTTWTDIFWKNRSNENRIDEIFFTFVNRFFWNELFTTKEGEKEILRLGNADEGGRIEEKNKCYKYLNGDNNISYKVFDNYKYLNNEIPIEFFEKLERILNNYGKYQGKFPLCTWAEFNFIPKYESSGVKSYNQVDRVVFFAVCKYFDHDDSIEDTEESFKRWMRVIWNLVSGDDENFRNEIRSTEAMRAAIKFIETLDSHKVYQSLYDYDDSKIKDSASAFDKRCKEEIIKIRQIYEDNKGTLRKHKKDDGSDDRTWEELIIDAENLNPLKGTIRFLYTDCEGNVNWKTFDAKWKKIKEVFLVKEEKRNTISEMIPFFNDGKILSIFSESYLSNSDGNLKQIFVNYPDYVHNYLMNQGKTHDLSLLQKDIILLCKYYSSYWIHTTWVKDRYVLSNYSSKSGYYEEKSFFIGENHVTDILTSCKDIEIFDENNLLEKGDINGEQYMKLKSLYIMFTYKYETDTYYFCWRKNGWVDMYNRDWNENLWKEGNKLHSQYSNENGDCKFMDAEGLIKELKRCIKESQ